MSGYADTSMNSPAVTTVTTVTSRRVHTGEGRGAVCNGRREPVTAGYTGDTGYTAQSWLLNLGIVLESEVRRG